MNSGSRVVVVGAGAAGHAAVQTLLMADVSARIDIVGAEDRPPYNRTTVNKGLLSGGVTDDAIALAPLSHPDLRWHLGRVAVGIDPLARRVELDDGTSLSGDAILLATGSRPRELPAAIAPEINGRVLTLRTPADTARLRTLAGDGPVVVAGAGLVGNELPAELRGLTPAVSLVDPADRPLARQVGPQLGAWITGEHHTTGTVTHWRRTIGYVTSSRRASTSDSQLGRGRAPLFVVLDDGTELEAGAVVACLGARPDTGWLTGSGITVHDPSGGLLVDSVRRVLGHPGIYAAGDLATVSLPSGTRARIEHWGSAVTQGRTAGRGVLVDLGLVDDPLPDSPSLMNASLPSHSTYVGQTKLTFLGWPAASRFREHVVTGELGRGRSLVVHTVNGRAVGAIGVGGARVLDAVREHITRAAPLEDIVNALGAA